MDLLIKNFKMPRDCKDCCRIGFSRCPSEKSDSLIPSDSGRPIGCPLVEVPPHGRLIDASELEASDAIIVGEDAWNMVHNAPTILEASK